MRDRAKRAPEPFPAVLQRLRGERGWSLESLGYEVRDQGPGVSLSLLGKLERGQRHPKAAHMELIAKALAVEPTVFAEYRLAVVRRLFDERELDLAAAVENLEALQDATAALLDRVDAELARQMRAASPTGRADPEPATRPAKRRRKSA